MNIKSRFCVKCGKKDAALIDGICADCQFLGLELKVPKKIALARCKHCKAINFEGIWIGAEEPNTFYFENLLTKKITLPDGAELKKISVKKTGEGSLV